MLPNKSDVEVSAHKSRLAYSIAQFLQEFPVGRTKLYEAFAKGTGPRSFRFGKRRMISVAAAEEWIRSLEAQTAEL